MAFRLRKEGSNKLLAVIGGYCSSHNHNDNDERTHSHNDDDRNTQFWNQFVVGTVPKNNFDYLNVKC